LNDDGSKAIVVGVGVSEKTFQTFHVTTHGKGGHSSRPPTAGDPVVALARAIVKIGEHRFPARILAETKASFEAQIDTAEPAYSPALRRAVRSAPNIAPADDALLSKDAGYNAELRTTCVTTMLEAAAQDNVLPTRVEAAVNCRILPGETRESVRDALVKAIGDPNVDVAMGADLGTSAPSPFEGEVVVAVQKAAANMFPGAPVVPTMSTGATDSRHLRRIGIAAFGVAPLAVTRAEARAGHVAHGPDERSSLRWFTPMGEYFRSIVRSLALAQPDAAPAALPAK
jgi:acetylornithine deacetylase/succinyl-diaminopimelate desuccinylase-like protein